MKQKRIVKIERETKETKIKLELNLEGSGISDVKTESVFLTICWICGLSMVYSI